MKKALLFLVLIIPFLSHAQLQRFTNTDIIVPIPDISVQGVTLHRAAKVKAIRIELPAKQVALDIDVYYLGENDSILNVAGVTPYQRSLIADMTTLTDVTTAIDLCKSNEEYISDSTGQRILNPVLIGKTYMYNFELFAAMMYQPSIVATICTQRIQYAASKGQLD